VAPANKNARAANTGADTAEAFTANATAGHGIRQQAKRLIVGAACWGLLPAGFASWLIQRGGMRRA
jgi:hypothetical protein